MILKTLKKIKKFKNFKFYFVKKDLVDIAVFDDITSNEIVYCLPEKSSFDIVKIRKSIPVIFNFGFFYNLLIFLIKKNSFINSIYLSYLKTKKVKILITFIDNSYIVSEMSKYSKNIEVIAIQNGIRTSNKIHGWDNLNFKSIYTFGEYEEKLLKIKNCNYEKLFKVGSLRYGIYKRNFEKRINEKNLISFISQWRPNFDTSLQENISIISNKLLTKIHNVCLQNNKNFRIIPTNLLNEENFKFEKKFYKKINNGKFESLIFNKINNYDSYMYAENSNLIITFCSTLAFELYGIGIKCLFLNLKDEKSYFKSNYFYEIIKHVPDFVKIDKVESGHIEDKIKYLIQMSNDEYEFLTKKSRDYLFIKKKLYAHEIIKENIKDYLDNIN